MSCPNAKEWDLLAMELLDEEQVERMLAHARGCAACREQFQTARRAHIDRLRMYEAFDRDHDTLREELMAALTDAAPGSLRDGWVQRGWRRLGGFAMSLNKSAGRRAAALLVPAACIVIAAVVFLAPKHSAFAAALEHMRQAQTIVSRYQMFMGDAETPMADGQMYLSDEHGMFCEMSNPGAGAMRMYHRLDGPLVVVQPALNLAMRMHGEFTDLHGAQQQPRPDEFIRKFLKMTGDADRALGRSEIDGHVCEGFEVSGTKLGLQYLGSGLSGSEAAEGAPPRSAARLWVDVESNLPARMEIEVYVRVMHSQMLAVYDQFEWDVPLGAALFEPDISPGMREIDIDIPPMSEETVVAGLRVYVDAAGRYPAVLDSAAVAAELSVALMTQGKLTVDPADPSSFISRELMQDTMTVSMACVFVQKLAADGHEPAYFGDVVGPEDADEVLLRWKLDDGQMRVIYGDLRAETVAASD
jgi:hypothetical protein